MQGVVDDNPECLPGDCEAERFDNSPECLPGDCEAERRFDATLQSFGESSDGIYDCCKRGGRREKRGGR